jgi:uncharacterized membrane protein
VALNANAEIERLKRAEDSWDDAITNFAGTMRFVRIHILRFALWIAINLGLVGAALEFDQQSALTE